MPNKSVVGGCFNVADAKQGISLHFIPFAGDERPEARRRRKLWVDFMRLKRAKWEPTSVLMQVFHFLMQVCLYTTTMCDKPLSARAKQMVSTTLQQVV